MQGQSSPECIKEVLTNIRHFRVVRFATLPLYVQVLFGWYAARGGDGDPLAIDLLGVLFTLVLGSVEVACSHILKASWDALRESVDDEGDWKPLFAYRKKVGFESRMAGFLLSTPYVAGFYFCVSHLPDPHRSRLVVLGSLVIAPYLLGRLCQVFKADLWGRIWGHPSADPSAPRNSPPGTATQGPPSKVNNQQDVDLSHHDRDPPRETGEQDIIKLDTPPESTGNDNVA